MSTTVNISIPTHPLNPSLLSSLTPTWERGMHTKVQNLVSGLAAKRINVIEWDAHLYNRCNADLVVLVSYIHVLLFESSNAYTLYDRTTLFSLTTTSWKLPVNSL